MTVQIHRRLRRNLAAAAGFLLAILTLCQLAQAQLRIVTYNTATGNVAPGVQTARTGMDIVLTSIGEEQRNGIARPIDVLLLQEQYDTAVSTESFVDLLNGIYGTMAIPTPYARGNLNADNNGIEGQAGGPALVYNTQSVQLIAENSFGTVSGSAQARSTMRYQLRPVGYDASGDFYVYNSHYKAGSSASGLARRNVEATSIRTNPIYGSDALGEGAHAIYVGDYNMSSSSEAAFQTLISAGLGQANDPINRLGSWSETVGFADIHTQAPCLSSCSGLTDGGVDDRFDFQLMTGELLDSDGFSYAGPNIPGMSHSYHAFGNNGTTFNTNINDASNTYVFEGVTSYTKTQILDALDTVSDHLPVVADYLLDVPPTNPQVLAAKWTFETSPPANLNNFAVGPAVAADVGTGTAVGTHLGGGTDWSTPVGNGSANSYSSNTWAVGDFYEFQISTEGYDRISISFDHTSSNTGPRDFGIQYSTTEGGTFNNTGITYSVLPNESPNDWDTGEHLNEHFFQFDLSDIVAIDDQATMFLRLVDLTTTSANNGTVGAAGTSRVDNFSIFYYEIVDGDFNEDGTVDAADYVTWRKLNGGDMTAYNEWVTNFGRTNSGMGGSGEFGSPSVPEPAAFTLLMLGICMLTARRGTLAAWTLRP